VLNLAFAFAAKNPRRLFSVTEFQSETKGCSPCASDRK